MHFYKKVAAMRVVRSLATGATGVIVQTILFEIFGIYLRILSPSTAVAVSAEVGLLTNFYLSNRFVFYDRREMVSLPSRLVRFHLAVTGSILLQWLFVFIAEHRTSNLLFIHGAYVAGLMLGFLWNYTCYFFFVWRQVPAPFNEV